MQRNIAEQYPMQQLQCLEETLKGRDLSAYYPGTRMRIFGSLLLTHPSLPYLTNTFCLWYINV